MSRFQLKSRNRWIVLVLVFGVGPMMVYLAFISPSVVKISSFRERIALQASGASLLDFGFAPVSMQEKEQLQEIRQDQLSRLKKIGSRESLLHFSGALADALAFQARSCGLRVIEADLENPLINGKYIPAGERAMEALAGLASPRWEELADPLDLPMLHLPSIELKLKVVSAYSQVFTFIESLPDIPILVQLTGLQATDEAAGKVYQLTIRGYYCGTENIRQNLQPVMQSAEDSF